MSQCTCNFISYTFGRAVTVNVVLPGPVFSDQTPSHIPNAPYPVLYLFHGGCGNENAWLRFTAAERYAEERQLAIVTCNLENTAGSDCTHLSSFGVTPEEYPIQSPAKEPKKISFQTFLTKELPEYIQGTFPISSLSQDTFMAGDGYAALSILRFVLKEPQRYRAVGLFQPRFLLPLSSHLSKIRQLESAIPLSFYMAASDLPGSGETSEALSMYLNSLGASVTRESFPQTGWGLCDAALLSFLDWLPRKDAYADQPKRRI